MNARGHDIHLRPAGGHGLVLVDGLQTDAIDRLKHDGFAPAAVLEVHPGSYQAWIKLADEPLSPQVRRSVAEGLARHYGGEVATAADGGSPYGRLAGFTSQAPEHARNGQQPYVLAHDCPGQVAARAPALLERIEQAQDRVTVQEERQRRLEGIRTAEPGHEADDPVQTYRKQAQRYLNQHGFKTDFARMDEAIAAEMAKSGRYTSSDIERGILEGSPNVQSHRAEHIEEYAKRTAHQAWAAPEVQQKRQEQNREKDFQLQRGRNGPGLRR